MRSYSYLVFAAVVAVTSFQSSQKITSLRPNSGCLLFSSFLDLASQGSGYTWAQFSFCFWTSPGIHEGNLYILDLK